MKIETPIDIEKIKELLPHRHPFLLIDRITDYKLNQYVVAQKNVSVNESFFNGHFPDRAVMPGVLVIEAMAQTALCLAKLSMEELKNRKIIGLLTSINNAKFKKMIIPGDVLCIKSEISKFKNSLFKFDCSVKVDGNVVAQSEISTFLSSEPNK